MQITTKCKHLLILILTIILMSENTSYARKQCNEAVCRGVVSKCLLLQSCMCVSDNSTCYKGCFDCLGSYMDECCPCFAKMFPDFCTMDAGEPELDGASDRQSVVEDFPDAVPGLFRALTELPDAHNRWKTVTFPISISVGQFDAHGEVVFSMKNGDRNLEADDFENFLTFNCSVAFLHDCVSRLKCRKNCLTMGASSYRWFHNGCCECVGEKCIYYGLDHSQCSNCPPEFEEEEEEEDDNVNEDDYIYDYEEEM